MWERVKEVNSVFLLCFRMKVYSHQNLLHLIHETEFIDSPEFESSVTGDEKFQVINKAWYTVLYLFMPGQTTFLKHCGKRSTCNCL